MACNHIAGVWQPKTRRVVIDSRDRNVAVHPTPDRYEIRLESALRDVASIKLVSADVPFSAYMVEAESCAVPVSVAGAQTAFAYLTVGDYADPNDFANDAAAALRSAAHPSFAVSYVPRTDNFLIECDVPFELRFSAVARSPARMLGFAEGRDYASDSAGRLRAPFRRDFEADKYMLMEVTSPNAEVLHAPCSTASSYNKGSTNRRFAIVSPRHHRTAYAEDSHFEKTWEPPLAQVAKIGVRFLRYDGSPYDFQNHEHRVEFEFRTLPQSVTY